MTAPIFIARILGPAMVIVGLGLLFEGETFRTMAGEFLRSPALLYFSSVATLVVGLAILNVHHEWTRDWRSLVTVFGWMFVIGGIFRILAPTLVQRLGESFIVHRRWPVIEAVITLALGAFLSVMGYQDIWNGRARPVRHRSSPTRASGTRARTSKRPRQIKKPGSANQKHRLD